MDKSLETPLRKFVEAYATQNTGESTDQLIHEYITRKAQILLLGEAEEDDDTADEDKKDKKDKKSDKEDDAEKDDDSDDEDSDDEDKKDD